MQLPSSISIVFLYVTDRSQEKSLKVFTAPLKTYAMRDGCGFASDAACET